VTTVMVTIKIPGHPEKAQNPTYLYYLSDHLRSSSPTGRTWFVLESTEEAVEPDSCESLHVE